MIAVKRQITDRLIECVRASRPPCLRSKLEFSKQEIVVPEGKHKDTLFRVHNQPFFGLLLTAMDDPRWNRRAVLGCVQAGKSFGAFVIPILYHLFEVRESVICGTPTLDVGKKKWNKELRPAIMAGRYRDLLPESGRSSRGGFAEEIRFRHGPTLTFVSGGAGDAQRSSDTARVVVVTEADKMDTAGDTSRETDPVSQMEARMASYDIEERQFYEECTVSIASGRIWTDYINGTASQIACPCPHCREYITPEREHFVGWGGAETQLQARKLGHFICPSCGEKLDDDQRRRMNERAKLVHRGQTIDKAGEISGDPPETDTLGFRWNAFNNLFWSSQAIAAKEWTRKRAENGEAKEKELRQFYWATPWEPPDADAPLIAKKVWRRFTDQRHGKGVVPKDTQWLTLGMDPALRLAHWVLIAWRENRRALVVDNGTIEIPSDDLGPERGTMIALRNFREQILGDGWVNTEGEILAPDQVWIDSNYQTDVVRAFCRESGDRFRPIIGRGGRQWRAQMYQKPLQRTKLIRTIGEQYHLVWFKSHQVQVVEIDVDYWKQWLQGRLATPVRNKQGDLVPGAMELFYSTDPNQHIKIAQHFASERVIVDDQGKRKWVKSGPNHLLDAATYASAAGHFCGWRLVETNEQAPATPSTSWFSNRTKKGQK